MILLDTNVFIDHLRGYPPAVRYLESLSHDDNIFFSAITEAELLAGKLNDDSSNRKSLLNLLNTFKKIIVTNPIALAAGDISRKHGLDIPDAIIASTAIMHNLELITRNVKDFKELLKLARKEIDV